MFIASSYTRGAGTERQITVKSLVQRSKLNQADPACTGFGDAANRLKSEALPSRKKAAIPQLAHARHLDSLAMTGTGRVMAKGGQHRIGDWRFDAAGAALSGPMGERRLEHRAARTLDLLCRRRGETVTHDEILAEVWDGRTVSPNSVAVVIADIRRSLDDNARDPRHIATVAKRGYRLNPGGVSGPPPARRRLGPFIAVLSVVAAVVLIILLRQSTAHVAVLVEPVQNATGLRSYDPLARALSELVTNRLTRETDAPVVDALTARISPAQRAIRLTDRLILWNGQPTLSLTATDPASGAVLWSGMAAGPGDRIAGTTIRALHDFGAHVRGF